MWCSPPMPRSIAEAIDLRSVRYILSGLFATVVHFAVLTFSLKVMGMQSAGLANLIAAVFGISTSFLGNRYFVFRTGGDPWGRQVIFFGILYALLALAHGVILYLWTDLGGLDYRIGFVLATGLQVAISYVGNKTLVFRP